MTDKDVAPYHEAAHAVRCFQLGRVFNYIVVDQDTPQGSYVDIDWNSKTNGDDSVERFNRNKIAILMAGWAAESILDESRERDFATNHKDYTRANKAAGNICEPGWEDKVIREELMESKFELIKDWRAVEALANAIKATKHLDYEPAIVIIKRALSN